jgi:uncharacterized protein YndB with AHSA1/START domain
MQTLTLEVSTPIKVTKAVLWEALTNPEQIKKYLFGTETKTDWKVGSPITFSGTWEEKPYVDKGTLLEIEKEKLIKYSYWSSFSGTEDVPENYANVCYFISDYEGKTLFTVTQDGHKTEETREHSKQNWQSILNSLKELLEH